MALWVPTGKLSDGTLLFGPLAAPPKETTRVVEISLNGATWYVQHSGEGISPNLREELMEWAQKRIAGYGKNRNAE